MQEADAYSILILIWVLISVGFEHLSVWFRTRLFTAESGERPLEAVCDLS